MEHFAGLRRQQDAVGWHVYSVPELVWPLCPRRGRHLLIVRGGAALGVSPPSGVVLDFMESPPSMVVLRLLGVAALVGLRRASLKSFVQ